MFSKTRNQWLRHSIYYKYYVVIVVISMLGLFVAGCSGRPKASVDSISAASKKNYYEQSSLKGTELLEELRNRRAAVSLATTNEDGTPNAAVVIPGVADEKTLMFGIADNQTKINIMARRYAVLTAYIYSPDEQDKLKRNRGARLILEVVTDKKKIDELMQKTKAQQGTIFMEIVKVLPIG